MLNKKSQQEISIIFTIFAIILVGTVIIMLLIQSAHKSQSKLTNEQQDYEREALIAKEQMKCLGMCNSISDSETAAKYCLTHASIDLDDNGVTKGKNTWGKDQICEEKIPCFILSSCKDYDAQTCRETICKERPYDYNTYYDPTGKGTCNLDLNKNNWIIANEYDLQCENTTINIRQFYWEPQQPEPKQIIRFTLHSEANGVKDLKFLYKEQTYGDKTEKKYKEQAILPESEWILGMQDIKTYGTLDYKFTGTRKTSTGVSIPFEKAGGKIQIGKPLLITNIKIEEQAFGSLTLYITLENNYNQILDSMKFSFKGTNTGCEIKAQPMYQSYDPKEYTITVNNPTQCLPGELIHYQVTTSLGEQTITKTNTYKLSWTDDIKQFQIQLIKTISTIQIEQEKFLPEFQLRLQEIISNLNRIKSILESDQGISSQTLSQLQQEYETAKSSYQTLKEENEIKKSKTAIP